ncbi:hypothetical protein O181_001268 [Austropuccinia psidii MF-1]|uniref:Uncharacterized protein n=1 Tax=Austropuccinia psidii MF-1 TaxID=1389203 RepID=A0A9Q3BA67_9BASI|nr:hypothetical protein [Austropuccinia psidii MF-1]
MQEEDSKVRLNYCKSEENALKEVGTITQRWPPPQSPSGGESMSLWTEATTQDLPCNFGEVRNFMGLDPFNGPMGPLKPPANLGSGVKFGPGGLQEPPRPTDRRR